MSKTDISSVLASITLMDLIELVAAKTAAQVGADATLEAATTEKPKAKAKAKAKAEPEVEVEEEEEEEEAGETISLADLKALYKTAKETDADEAKGVLAEFDVKVVSKLKADQYSDVETALNEMISGGDEEEEEEELEEVTPQVLLDLLLEAYADEEAEEDAREVAKGFGLKAKKPTLAQCKKLSEEDLGDCYDEVAELLPEEDDD